LRYNLSNNVGYSFCAHQIFTPLNLILSKLYQPTAELSYMFSAQNPQSNYYYSGLKTCWVCYHSAFLRMAFGYYSVHGVLGPSILSQTSLLIGKTLQNGYH